MPRHPYRLNTTLPNRFVGPPQTITIPPPNAFGIEPAKPDTSQMVPSLQQQLADQAAKAARNGIDLTPEYFQSNNVQPWTPDVLFDSKSFGHRREVGFPSQAGFDLYLLATLCRHAYTFDADTRDMIFRVLGDDWTQSRLFGQSPNVQVDLWQGPNGLTIVAFNGAVNIIEELAFAFPGVTNTTTFPLPAGVQMWRGMALNTDRLHTAIFNFLSPSSRAGRLMLLTGHSFGGVLANYFAYVLNKDFYDTVSTTQDLPVIGTVSFGMPAAFIEPTPRPANWRTWTHLRVNLVGDPVPQMVQGAWTTAKKTLDLSLIPQYVKLGLLPFDSSAPSWSADDTVDLGQPTQSQKNLLHRSIVSIAYKSLTNFQKNPSDESAIYAINRLHSIVNYALSARERAINTADTPAGRWNRLEQATTLIEKANG
jgi:hypothetical protein